MALDRAQPETYVPSQSMPTYEYACTSCGNSWEEFQKITEAPLEVCPKCNAHTAKRQVSGGTFILKGGGWYADLYASPKSNGSKAGDAKSGDANGSSANATAGSGESKTSTGSSQEGKSGSSSGSSGSSSGSSGSSPAST